MFFFIAIIFFILFSFLTIFWIVVAFKKIQNITVLLKQEETIPIVVTEYYKKDIETYVSTHELLKHLENDSCILKLDDYSKGFYIKVINKSENNGFNIEGNKYFVNTIWAVYQMYFSNKITYKGILFWTQDYARRSRGKIKIQYF